MLQWLSQKRFDNGIAWLIVHPFKNALQIPLHLLWMKAGIRFRNLERNAVFMNINILGCNRHLNEAVSHSLIIRRMSQQSFSKYLLADR